MAAAEELFDLCDEWGRPLGRTKPRSRVHRDGDWHRSFHCWLLAGDGGPEPSILLQRRALDKDTWPGLWDVSVAGHYAAGEGIEGGLRELREEAGLQVSEDELVPAARRREVVQNADGLFDREVQDVYFLARRVDLLALKPNAEVIAVASVPASALLQLGDGTLARVVVIGGVVDGDGRIHEADIELSSHDIVPRRDGYYARVADFAARLVRGERPPSQPGWW